MLVAQRHRRIHPRCPESRQRARDGGDHEESNRRQTECQRVRRLYADQQMLIREKPESAAAILSFDAKDTLPQDSAEQAALVTVTRTLMNLDEFITRD